MDYQSGLSLGPLHQTLGIPANRRISVSMTLQRTVVEDLDEGIRYEVPSADPTNIKRERFRVPQYVKDIIALSDADLVKQFRDALEKRIMDQMDTLRSEFCFRGINPTP